MYSQYIIIILAAILSTTTLAIILLRDYICQKLGIIDTPDEKRKIHKKPMPLIGGLACYISFILSLIISILYLEPENIKNLLIFFLISSSIFVFGLLDDRNNIKASIKSLIFLIIVFLFLPLDQSLIVKHLEFVSLINKPIILNQGSFFFTIFCLFLFFNAVNFSDGANGISIALGIFWISIIIFKSNSYNLIYLTILFSLILLFLFNLGNKLFLGNSGSNLISIIIGMLYIKIYNTEKLFLCDEIFIYFMIPGLDMVRVTIERILERKSPLSADKSHLHHHLMKTFNQNIVWLPYLSFSILPLIILEISHSSLISILVMLILYLIIITFYKKKRR